MIPIGLIESAGSTLYSLGADRAGDGGGLTLNADEQRHVAAKTELISNLFIGPTTFPRFGGCSRARIGFWFHSRHAAQVAGHRRRPRCCDTICRPGRMRSKERSKSKIAIQSGLFGWPLLVQAGLARAGPPGHGEDECNPIEQYVVAVASRRSRCIHRRRCRRGLE
jgi:hypothetical protein